MNKKEKRAMMNTLKRNDVYEQIDSLVGNVSSVLFGSTALSRLPISELVHFFGLNLSVCNRSIEGLTTEKAIDHLEECVFMLQPHKLFLCFGDVETLSDDESVNSFIASYEKLINRIVVRHDCDIYILSPISSAATRQTVSDKLRQLAKDNGCTYIDISETLKAERPVLSLFRKLTFHIRESNIGFADAMKIASMAL